MTRNVRPLIHSGIIILMLLMGNSASSLAQDVYDGQAPAYWFNKATPFPSGTYFPALPGYLVHYPANNAERALVVSIDINDDQTKAVAKLQSASNPAIQTVEVKAAAGDLPATVGSTFGATNPGFHQWAWQMFLWLTQDDETGNPRFLGFESGQDLKESLALGTPDELDFKIRTAKSDEDDVQQAGSGGLLVDQLGQVTYYTENLNDTFVTFLKGIKPNIYLGATANMEYPVDSLELKTSWRVVMVDGKPVQRFDKHGKLVGQFKPDDLDKFLTTTANILPYREMTATLADGQTKQSYWGPSKQAVSATMAMVGMHVVGMVQGHPELIWASFEHQDNAPSPDQFGPRGSYVGPKTNWSFYDGQTPTMDCNSNFNATNSSKLLFNQPAASPVYQIIPYGGDYYCPPGSPPPGSPVYPGNVKTIMDLNKSVLGQLPGSSLPQAYKSTIENYRLVGSLWTTGSLPAVGPVPVRPGDEDCSNGNYAKALQAAGANERGSVYLANTSIESFTQGRNCFDCHNNNGQQKPGNYKLAISHIFYDIWLSQQKNAEK